MTLDRHLFQIRNFLQTGTLKILSHPDPAERADRPASGIREAAMFATSSRQDQRPDRTKAFDYWSTMTSLDKWFALPPRHPSP